MATRKVTNRGFRVYAEFKDSHDGEIRVQQSSEMGGPFVWIFSKAGPMYGEEAGKDWPPHLTVAQAQRMIHALTRFVDENRPTRKPRGK